MLPKGKAWGWYRNGGTFCAACNAEQGSPHAKDCETVRVQAALSEVVGAIRWYIENDDTNEDPENATWLAGRDRARAALASVERLGRG